MSKPFQSSLSNHLQAFIETKHAAGYKYKGNIGKLHKFDLLLVEKYPDATTVTKENFNSWVEVRSIHPSTLLNDVNVIRQFSKYLNGIGINAYIPPRGRFKLPPRYEPHIFTDQEKVAFFRAVDQYKFNKYSPTKSYVAPMVFRILYCCGVRTSEARLLKCNDIDLETGKVLIRESKRWAKRIIYINWDLLANLNEYDAIMGQLIPDREAFFPNRQGSFFSSTVFGEWFHEFWDELPEASRITGNRARVHDWRHTFFTDRLNLWVQEGKDINSLEMYLSEYGGHSHFTGDDYYEHLTVSFYPEMHKRLADSNKYILPEVQYER